MTAVGSRLRVAVVGAGSWGAQHARVFGSRADTELVGVRSRSLDRTQDRAGRWGAEAFDDLSTMISQTAPELISVCLPNTMHYAITHDLIKYRLPLLVEKPLVFDLREGRQLIKAADEAGLFFAINFNHRFAEPVVRALNLIGDHELGEIDFATWRFGGDGSSAHHPFANLIETQCHGIDLLQQLAGQIDAVSAEMTTRQGMHETLVAVLRFRTGAVGSLVGSYRSSYAYPGCTVHRDQRLLREADDRRHRPPTDRFPARGPCTPRLGSRLLRDAGRSFEQTFDRNVTKLVAAVRAGGVPPVPAADGLNVLEVCDAIIRSLQTGRRTRVEH